MKPSSAGIWLTNRIPRDHLSPLDTAKRRMLHRICRRGARLHGAFMAERNAFDQLETEHRGVGVRHAPAATFACAETAENRPTTDLRLPNMPLESSLAATAREARGSLVLRLARVLRAAKLVSQFVVRPPKEPHKAEAWDATES